MDQNHPAWKLAEAVQASHQERDLDQRMQAQKPTADTIALAYAISFRDPFGGDSANRDVLLSQLQRALMKEHVAAQKRMGKTINWLTGVLVVLTVVLVAFGSLDIWQRWRAGEIPWQSTAAHSFPASRAWCARPWAACE